MELSLRDSGRTGVLSFKFNRPCIILLSALVLSSSHFFAVSRRQRNQASRAVRCAYKANAAIWSTSLPLTFTAILQMPQSHLAFRIPARFTRRLSADGAFKFFSGDRKLLFVFVHSADKNFQKTRWAAVDNGQGWRYCVRKSPRAIAEDGRQRATFSRWTTRMICIQNSVTTSRRTAWPWQPNVARTTSGIAG